MGKQIHLTKVLRLFEKSPVVDFKSILRIVGKRSYAKLLVSTLLKKNVLKKIGKGVYTIHEESSLSVFAYTPAYLGLQSALSYHKLWEQETIPIVITTRKVRRGVRVVLGSNILVRNIDTKYFFGFEYVLDGKFYVPYSDIEKTAIDLTVFKVRVDKVLCNAIRKRVDKDKLSKYLKRYPLKLQELVKKKLSL